MDANASAEQSGIGTRDHAARALLPSPNFAWDSNTGEYKACIRPLRAGGMRLEAVPLSGKTLVHNYGHGGAGISMSWGCAIEVRSMVAAVGQPARVGRVAVIGAGVMGLTSALLLAEAGYAVAIYANEAIDLTSHKAGGQWAPSFTSDGATPAERDRFGRVIRNAHDAHRALIGAGWGVSERLNYAIEKSKGLELAVAHRAIEPPTHLTALPFALLNGPGWAYQTLLVKPPVLMAKLTPELAARGVHVQIRPFRNTAALAELVERVVVNCTGWGAKRLTGDRAMAPGKGLLVVLPAQPALQWLYSSGSTYVFPRSDRVVVGGSCQPFDNEDRDKAVLSDIRRMAEDVFAGRAVSSVAPADWMLDGK